jgi:hypothetical protein
MTEPIENVILTRRSARPFALAILCASAALVVVFAAFYTRLPTTAVIGVFVLSASAVVSQVRRQSSTPQSELQIKDGFLIWRNGRVNPPAQGKIALEDIATIIEKTWRGGETPWVTLEILTRDGELHVIPADCTPDYPDQLHARLLPHFPHITRREITQLENDTATYPF